MGRTKKSDVLFVAIAQDIFRFVKEAKFITKGPNLTVLKYARIVTGENKIKMIASDLDLFLTMEFESVNVGTHDFILLIEDLYKIFDGMNGKVTFRTGKESYQILIDFGREKHSLLKGASPDLEYPSFDFFDMEERTVTLPKDNLWFVAQSMSDDESRYNLNGVCPVEGYGLVSTDGHRLHVVEAEMTEHGKIYPASFVSEMLRIAKFTKSQVSFACRKADKFRNSDTGYFSVTEYKTKWTLYSKMIDAGFPEVDLVIPKLSRIIISIDSVEATRILKRVKKFCSKKDKDGDSVPPYVTLKIEMGRMFFTAHRYGEIVSEMEMNVENLGTIRGDNFIVGLNADYFIEALKKETEIVKVGFDEQLDPVKIDRSDGSYAVIMPIVIK